MSVHSCHSDGLFKRCALRAKLILNNLATILSEVVGEVIHLFFGLPRVFVDEDGLHAEVVELFHVAAAAPTMLVVMTAGTGALEVIVVN